MADNRIEFEIAMKDLATKELQKFKQELTNTVGASSAFNKNIGDGEKLLKNFYKEQRLQDRTMREATNALTGFTVGMSGLLMSGGNASNQMKEFNKAILSGVTAMQGAEFASASLGIAGRNLGGTMGKIATFLSGNAGVIGAVIGATVALWQMVPAFGAVDEAAKKAAESGLSEFEKRFRKMAESKNVSAEQVLTVFANIQEVIQNSKNKIESFYEVVTKSTPQGEMSVRQLKKGFAEQKEELEATIATYQGYAKIIGNVTKELNAQKELNKIFKDIGITTEGVVVTVKKMGDTFGNMLPTVKELKKEIAKIKAPTTDVVEYKNEWIYTFNEADRARILFYQAVSRGTSALALQVGDWMYAAFDRSFKGANSMLEIFLANVLSAMAEIAAKQLAAKAVAGLLSLIPGIGLAGSLGAELLGGLFHQGGTVQKAHNGNYTAQPASREFPIMVRGGETVRTEGQERDLQNRKSSGGSVIHINFNSPVSDSQFVVSSIKKAMRETGLTIDKLAVNNRSKIVLA